MLQKFNVDVEMQLIRLDNIIEQKDLTKKENSNKILKYYKSLNKEKLNNIYLWLFSGFKNCVLEINKEFTFKFNAKNNLILSSNVTYYIKDDTKLTNKQLYDMVNEIFSHWSNAGDESFTLKKFKIKKVTYHSDIRISEITNRTLII
jgi:hypothetical protein